jgi:hypothetical protein
MGLAFGTLTAGFAAVFGPFQQGSAQQALVFHQEFLQPVTHHNQSGSLLSEAAGFSFIHLNTSIYIASVLIVPQIKTGIKFFS